MSIFARTGTLVRDNGDQLLLHYGTHNVSTIYIGNYCGIRDNSMTKISFLNTYSSDAESHTLIHEFLWYFHCKHLQQSEKLALKHHSSLKTSRAIYFYKHMRKPSFFFLLQAWKKSIIFENLFLFP